MTEPTEIVRPTRASTSGKEVSYSQEEAIGQDSPAEIISEVDDELRRAMREENVNRIPARSEFGVFLAGQKKLDKKPGDARDALGEMPLDKIK